MNLSDSLEQIQTPALLVSLEWSVQTHLYPSILSKLSSSEESR